MSHIVVWQQFNTIHCCKKLVKPFHLICIVGFSPTPCEWTTSKTQIIEVLIRDTNSKSLHIPITSYSTPCLFIGAYVFIEVSKEQARAINRSFKISNEVPCLVHFRTLCHPYTPYANQKWIPFASKIFTQMWWFEKNTRLTSWSLHQKPMPPKLPILLK